MPAWVSCTVSAVTSTLTRSPIKRHGTEWALAIVLGPMADDGSPSISTAQSAPTRRLSSRAAEGRAAVGQRPQGGGLVAREAGHGRLAGGAVDALIGDLARPLGQMRLQGREALEGSPRDRVALHVAHAALVLALGPRPVRRAGLGPEAPVPCEGVELGVEHHLPRRRVAASRCRIRARALSSSTSSGTPPRAAKALSMPSNPCSGRSPRKARTCSRREWPSVATKTDTGRRAPSISTRLRLSRSATAGPGASRTSPSPALRPAARRSGATARSTVRLAHLNAPLGRELLANHVRVARVAAESLGQPAPKTVERRLACRCHRASPATLAQPPPHRRPRAPQLRRDPPRPRAWAPSASASPTHRPAPSSRPSADLQSAKASPSPAWSSRPSPQATEGASSSCRLRTSSP